MYNMEISIFGYKVQLELLILIGIIYLILVGHTVCGCCRYGMIETFDKLSNSDLSGNVQDISGNSHSPYMKHRLGNNNIEPGGGLAIAKSKSSGKEGFTGANINYGQSSPYDLSSSSSINTSSWSAPNMTVVKGQPLSDGVKKFLNREPQPVPLPEGEMLLFANTPFKPECCPNTYSTSTGCACMTGKQYNFLVQRGMNNVPYSEY